MAKPKRRLVGTICKVSLTPLACTTVRSPNWAVLPTWTHYFHSGNVSVVVRRCIQPFVATLHVDDVMHRVVEEVPAERINGE